MRSVGTADITILKNKSSGGYANSHTLIVVVDYFLAISATY